MCERDENQHLCQSCVRASLRNYYLSQRHQFVMFQNVSSLFGRFPFLIKDHQLHYVSIIVPSNDADTTVVLRLYNVSQTLQWFLLDESLSPQLEVLYI